MEKFYLPAQRSILIIAVSNGRSSWRPSNILFQYLFLLIRGQAYEACTMCKAVFGLAEPMRVMVYVKNKYRLYDETEVYTWFRTPRKPMFRRPERAARGRLIWFPRWSKSRIHRLFHRIRFLYHTSMFLTNQIAQLRVLDFTYTTSRAVSRRRKPPRTLILPTANTYTTHREHLYYLRTVYCCILEKNSFQGLRLYSYYLEA